MHVAGNFPVLQAEMFKQLWGLRQLAGVSLVLI